MAPDPTSSSRTGRPAAARHGAVLLTALVALLGPDPRGDGFASTRITERTIEIGPRTGEVFRASTPTHTTAALELEGKITRPPVASFEAPSQYICDCASTVRTA